MKADLLKILVEHLDEALSKTGQFIKVLNHDSGCEGLYQWTEGKELRAYLGVQVLFNRPAAFKLICYWTRNNLEPFDLVAVMSPQDCPDPEILKDDPISGRFAFDVGTLWSPRTGFIWSLATRSLDAANDPVFRPSVIELSERIPIAMQALSEKLERYLFPYLCAADEQGTP